MVQKKCWHCGQYFGGDLNGEYVCPACVRLGAVGLRPLMTLDGLDDGLTQGPEAGPSPTGKLPGHERRLGAKGQAA